MNKDPLVYLGHIFDAMERLEQYLVGFDLEQLKADEKTTAAVVREFTIIGEAANKTPIEFQTANPTIPWKNIVGFRNVIVHNYFEVDLPTVWQICQKDVPELKTQIKKLLP